METTENEEKWYKVGGETALIIFLIYIAPLLLFVQYIENIEIWWIRLLFTMAVVALLSIIAYFTCNKLEKRIRNFFYNEEVKKHAT